MRRRHLLATTLMLAPLVLAGCAQPSVTREGALQGPAGQSMVVYFNADSAALDDAAKDIVKGAAEIAVRNPTAPVAVIGFADPEGSRAFNQALSRARAENVANELRTAGVAAGRIAVLARGPVPAVDLAQQSRRVEIRIGGTP